MINLCNNKMQQQAENYDYLRKAELIDEKKTKVEHTCDGSSRWCIFKAMRKTAANFSMKILLECVAAKTNKRKMEEPVANIQNFIDGKFEDPLSNKWIDNYNPATGTK